MWHGSFGTMKTKISGKYCSFGGSIFTKISGKTDVCVCGGGGNTAAGEGDRNTWNTLIDLTQSLFKGGVLGTFWKPPSQNPFWEPFSEPFFPVKPTAGPLLTLLRTLPQNPSHNDPLGVHPRRELPLASSTRLAHWMWAQGVAPCRLALRNRPPLYRAQIISSKKKGPGKKGAPRNHPEISSQKLADFECRFPYDSYGRTEHHFGPFLGEGLWGQYPAAPCSPGPFVLLVKSGGLWKFRISGVQRYPFWTPNMGPI